MVGRRKSVEDFSGYLLPGERVVWTGRPKGGLAFTPADGLLIPFSLFWAGFAVFWNVQVWATNAPVSFKLFGLPFLIISVYVTVGRFWVDASVRQHQSYAVTNKRILIRRVRWF